MATISLAIGTQNVAHTFNNQKTIDVLLLCASAWGVDETLTTAQKCEWAFGQMLRNARDTAREQKWRLEREAAAAAMQAAVEAIDLS